MHKAIDICKPGTRYRDIGDIVSTLEEHCRNKGIDPANCYIWICALCINQHRVGREAALGQHVENNVFMTLFGNQLSRIGKVLVLMSPWHNPLCEFRGTLARLLVMAAPTLPPLYRLCCRALDR